MKKVLKQLAGEATIFHTSTENCALFFSTNFNDLSYDETREVVKKLLGEGEPCGDGYSPKEFTSLGAEKSLGSGNYFEVV